jgi:hypothetical protein
MSSTAGRIAWLRVSSCILPLAAPISDTKVLTEAAPSRGRDRISRIPWRSACPTPPSGRR